MMRDIVVVSKLLEPFEIGAEALVKPEFSVFPLVSVVRHPSITVQTFHRFKNTDARTR